METMEDEIERNSKKCPKEELVQEYNELKKEIGNA
jgi:hypothetical protein